MRISDWSSDVCSSDLSVVRLRLVAGRVAAVGRRHRGRGLDGLGGFRGHGFGRAAHGVELAPCLRVRLAHRGVDVAHRVLGFRSEEHTSELQSLMRISYAVFCLKQKKKTNTTNTH